MTDPIPVPEQAVPAARAALASLPTGTCLWGYELTRAAAAAVEAAGPHILTAAAAAANARIAELDQLAREIYSAYLDIIGDGRLSNDPGGQIARWETILAGDDRD